MGPPRQRPSSAAHGRWTWGGGRSPRGDRGRVVRGSGYDRWAAFSKIAERDPSAQSRHEGIDHGRACLVLRDASGARYMRASWYATYVRALAPRETQGTINQRMLRVG